VKKEDIMKEIVSKFLPKRENHIFKTALIYREVYLMITVN